MSSATAKQPASPGLSAAALMDAWKPQASPWLIAGTVMLATFMEVLDTSVANVSLPHIAGSLAASLDESSWVLTSYLVSNAIVLPLSGWFSRLLGRKFFYMSCVAIFTASSFMCGLAPNLTLLVIFRILQGAGGGALQPISQAILVESFPRNKQGMAMAIYGMGVVAAPILGPTLGGWITDNYSWRWIFLINVPVGILSLFMTATVIVDSPFAKKAAKGSVHIDYFGLGVLTVGLAALQIVLDKGQREDWFESSFIVWTSIIAVVCLGLVVKWELARSEPLIDFRLLGNRNFALACITMFSLGFVLYGSLILLPLFLQTLMGYTAMQSGEVISPGGIVVMACMPFVGRMIGRVQPKWMLLFGTIITAISLIMMAHFTLEIDFSTAVWARNVQGLGLAFLFVPLNTLAFSSVPREKTNNATGLINLARNIGGSMGIAGVTTLLARQQQVHQTILGAHMTVMDAPYQSLRQNMMMRMLSNFDSATAAVRADVAMGRMLMRQASMLAYVDTFWILASAFVLLIPLILLMKIFAPTAGRPLPTDPVKEGDYLWRKFARR